MTDVELRRLEEQVASLDNYVPQSEHWRIREVRALTTDLIRSFKVLSDRSVARG